jgi:hypothetical protein
MKKITDKKILDLVKKYSEGDEEAGNVLLLSVIHLLLDIRRSVEKRPAKNIVTDPTKAKKGDIVVGGLRVW